MLLYQTLGYIHMENIKKYKKFRISAVTVDCP